MGDQKTIVIINPASSAGRTGRRQREILAAVESHFGRGFSLFVTKRPKDATSSAREASLRGIELVIAVGGDGTIQEVVNGLMEAAKASDRRPQLGIINAGTGHGFAQSLGLPAGLDAQCAGIAGGSIRRIDIGRAAFSDGTGRPVERYFINECQAGIGGRVVEKVQAGHKKLGGFLGFGLATLTTALSYPNRSIRFSLDDGPERSGTFIGIVAANGHAMAGGMRLAPRAIGRRRRARYRLHARPNARRAAAEFPEDLLGHASRVAEIRLSSRTEHFPGVGRPGLLRSRRRAVRASALPHRGRSRGSRGENCPTGERYRPWPTCRRRSGNSSSSSASSSPSAWSFSSAPCRSRFSPIGLSMPSPSAVFSGSPRRWPAPWAIWRPRFSRPGPRSSGSGRGAS